MTSIDATTAEFLTPHSDIDAYEALANYARTNQYVMSEAEREERAKYAHNMVLENYATDYSRQRNLVPGVSAPHSLRVTHIRYLKSDPLYAEVEVSIDLYGRSYVLLSTDSSSQVYGLDVLTICDPDTRIPMKVISDVSAGLSYVLEKFTPYRGSISISRRINKTVRVLRMTQPDGTVVTVDLPDKKCVAHVLHRGDDHILHTF